MQNIEVLHSDKKWADDRSQYSMSGARGKLYHMHYKLHKDTKPGQKVPKFRSSKKFKWTTFQKMEIGFAQFHKIKEVPTNQCFDKNGKPTQLFKDSCYININDDSRAQYHSKAPVKGGRKPSQVFSPDVTSSYFFSSSYCPERYRDETVYDDYVVKGGFSGTIPHLQSFARRSDELPKSLNRVKKTFEPITKRFGLGYELNTPPVAAIGFNVIKPSSKAGGDSSAYFSNKGEGWSSAVKAAMLLCKQVSKGITPSFSTYTCGDREKRNDDKVAGDILQCRLVQMQDYVEYLLARPWTFLVERFLKEHLWCPIKIGKSSANEGYHELVAKDKIYAFAIEIDWKLFDSSMAVDTMIGGFALIRGLFPEGDFVDNMFFYFASGVIRKFVVLGDGNCYKITGGVPSGTVWTSLINSFCHMILLEQLLSSYRPIGSNMEFDYDVSGDDGKIFLHSKININKDSLIAHAAKRFNMQLKIRMMGEPIAEHPDDSVEFLKTCLYWKDGVAVPTTSPRAVVTRIKTPAKDYKTYGELENFIFSQSESLINHDDAVTVIARYLAYVKKYHYKEELVFSTSDEYDVRTFIRNFNQMVYFAPDPRDNLGVISVAGLDKVYAYQDEEISSKPIDWNYVRNWLKDNTLAFSKWFNKPKYRTPWFVVLMGPQYDLFNLLKEVRKNYSKVVYNSGLPSKRFLELIRNFKKHTGGINRAESLELASFFKTR